MMSRFPYIAQLRNLRLGRHIFCSAVFLFLLSAQAAIADEADPVASPYSFTSTNRFEFRNLTVEDGLPDNNVSSIVQDRLGFMWFGTRLGGVSRFDGYEFRQFQHSTDDPESLSSNDVWTLFKDSTGTLWVGTNGGGLDRYDEATESFVHYLDHGTGPLDQRNAYIKSFLEDRQGRLWIGSDGGLSLYDRDVDTFTTITHEPGNTNSLAGNSVRAIIQDRESGRLWLGTRHRGISIYDPDKQTFVHHRQDPTNPSSLSNNSVTSFYQDSNGAIWVGTRDGLNRFDRSTGEFVRYSSDRNDPKSIKGGWVRAILEDKKGRFWVGTLDGLNLYNPASDSFNLIERDRNHHGSFRATEVSSIFEDREGAIWFGSQSAGLSRLDAAPPKFLLTQTLSDTAIRSSTKASILAIHYDDQGRL